MSIFNPPSSTSEIRDIIPIGDFRYKKINGSRNLKGDQFPNSEIQYDIEISDTTGLLMNRTDVRIRGSIGAFLQDNKKPTVPLTSAALITLAMDFPPCFFQKEAFLINDIPVEDHTDNIPQLHAYKRRISKSNSWMNSVGGIDFWDVNFKKRLARVSSDLTLTDFTTGNTVDSTVQELVADTTYIVTNSVAIPVGVNGVRTATFSVGNVPNSNTVWVKNDYILVAGQAMRVIATQAGPLLYLADNGGIDIGDDTLDNNVCHRVHWDAIPLPIDFKAPTIGFEVPYVPTLSIFEYDHILPYGTYSIVLTPHSNYKHRAIESIVHQPALANFDIYIEDMFVMACLVDGEYLKQSQIVIDLSDVNVKAATLITGTFEDRITLKSSTTGLSFAVQNHAVETNTTMSLTKFIDDTAHFERLIRTYDFNYANQRQPRDTIDVEYSTTINHYNKIYKDNLVYNGQYLGMYGVETFDEFMQRGPYVRLPFLKSGGNTDTSCQAKITFLGDPVINTVRLFFFNHYSKVAIITLDQGKVANVEVRDE